MTRVCDIHCAVYGRRMGGVVLTMGTYTAEMKGIQQSGEDGSNHHLWKGFFTVQAVQCPPWGSLESSDGRWDQKNVH